MQFGDDQERSIRSIVRTCGQQIMTLAAQGYQIDQKGPGDYVTEVDRAIDRALTAAFSRLFAQDILITEEDPASCDRWTRTGNRRWCIDPLDGTQDFINGDKDYALMVGLLEGGLPTLGWIYAPEYDRLCFGGTELGLWQQQADNEAIELSVRYPEELKQRVILGDKDHTKYSDMLLAQNKTFDFWCRPGSFGLKVLDIIDGRAGLYGYFNGRVKVWDTVAPFALARSAGLVCCDLAGDPIRYDLDVLNPQTLAHLQPIVIGWPDAVAQALPDLRAAVLA